MGRVLSLLAFFLILTGIFYLSQNGEIVIISPLPRVFGQSIETKTPVNTWYPKENTVTELKSKPFGSTLELSAKSAILIDYESAEATFSKNTHERLPAASTVKIMTALVALEKNKLRDVFTVSEKAYKTGENSMNLSIGEKLSLEELLYGLILVSGNDAAVTIAEGVGGSEEKFVEEMNTRARELGLKDSKFVNASGLDVEGQTQYSTAYDLAVISRYLWENHPDFRKISETYHWTSEANAFHKAFDLYSDTNLLTTYPGVRGIKPGFTWEAGLCLVTLAENEGKRIIAVILGSNDRRGDMKELLDYGFNSYGITASHPGLDL